MLVSVLSLHMTSTIAFEAQRGGAHVTNEFNESQQARERSKEDKNTGFVDGANYNHVGEYSTVDTNRGSAVIGPNGVVVDQNGNKTDYERDRGTIIGGYYGDDGNYYQYPSSYFADGTSETTVQNLTQISVPDQNGYPPAIAYSAVRTTLMLNDENCQGSATIGDNQVLFLVEGLGLIDKTTSDSIQITGAFYGIGTAQQINGSYNLYQTDGAISIYKNSQGITLSLSAPAPYSFDQTKSQIFITTN